MISWESRLIGAIPLPPIAAGALVAAMLVAGATIWFWLNGAPVFAAGEALGVTSAFRTAAVVSILIGYTMAAGRYLNVSISRDLIEAGRLLPEALDPQNALWLHGVTRSVNRRGRVAGAVGFLCVVVVMHMPRDASTAGSGAAFDPAAIWTGVATPVLFFLLARAASLTAFGAGERAQEGMRIPPGEIDLLDLRVHLVEGRVGLRLALVWIVGSTISSLLIFDPDIMLPLMPVVSLGLGVALLALILPTRRLHHRIRAAKKQELERVTTRVRAARDAMMRGEEAASGRLADLLAYAHHLEDVREWPFDNRTLSRFVLYMLIPIGSWLGGALVERVVERVLD